MPQRRTAPVVFRIVLYFAAAWGIVAALASGLFPGAPFIALGIGAYTTIPVLVFARWRGWPFYPGAAFRLFVVRPFWYTQILLPLVAAWVSSVSRSGCIRISDPRLVRFAGRRCRCHGRPRHRLRRLAQSRHPPGRIRRTQLAGEL
jgi:hypothetical protein